MNKIEYDFVYSYAERLRNNNEFESAKKYYMNCLSFNNEDEKSYYGLLYASINCPNKNVGQYIINLNDFSYFQNIIAICKTDKKRINVLNEFISYACEYCNNTKLEFNEKIYNIVDNILSFYPEGYDLELCDSLESFTDLILNRKKYEKAVDYYSKILMLNEKDTIYWKRLLAILKCSNEKELIDQDVDFVKLDDFQKVLDTTQDVSPYLDIKDKWNKNQEEKKKSFVKKESITENRNVIMSIYDEEEHVKKEQPGDIKIISESSPLHIKKEPSNDYVIKKEQAIINDSCKKENIERKNARKKKHIFLFIITMLLIALIAFLIIKLNSCFEKKGENIYIENGLKYTYHDEYCCLFDVEDKSKSTYIISKKCNRILSNSFLGCLSLKEIVIPDNVTEIQTHAFKNCISLEIVIIENSEASLYKGIFYGCTSIKKVVLPFDCQDRFGILFTGSNFYNTYNDDVPSSLEEVVIIGDTTSIKYYAFENISSLKAIQIPSTVNIIADHAFYNCTQLTKIEIPNSVTRIGDRAFYNCKLLSEIRFDETINEWNSVQCGTDWVKNTLVEKIICTDGEVSI